MTKIITIITLFVTSLFFGQGKYEEGMGKAFQLWKEGNNTEASAMFERIASAEKNNWLPNYYVGLVNVTTAFTTQDKEKLSALLDKAQDAIDAELAKTPENPELLVVQAMIYTAWIVYDPMANGQKYGAKAMQVYEQAIKIAPENPRVVFCKAEFEIGGAKFWGADIKPICAEVDRAIALFATFKPENQFSPSWGLDRALETQKECKK
jgi:tetratricopeptide (TPR) repeat protein